MNPRVWLAFLILALAAAGTWWLLQRVTPPTVPRPAPPTHVPDYTVTGATVTTLNRQGQPQAVMTAPLMQHHPDDDSVDVSEPRIRYFVAGSLPWHLRAEHARLPSGGELVELSGDVRMQHPGNHGGPPLLIETDKMNVNLNTNIASTADPVLITQGASRMTGVGMRAFLNDNHLVLQSQVQGEYAHQR